MYYLGHSSCSTSWLCWGHVVGCVATETGLQSRGLSFPTKEPTWLHGWWHTRYANYKHLTPFPPPPPHTHSPSGIGVTFGLCGLLLSCYIFIFLTATLLQKVCDDIAPPEYVVFANVLDNPSLWGGRSFVSAFVDSQFGSDVNLTVTNILRCAFLNSIVFLHDHICSFSRCAENDPIYQVLQLGTVLNLTGQLEAMESAFVVRSDIPFQNDWLFLCCAESIRRFWFWFSSQSCGQWNLAWLQKSWNRGVESDYCSLSELCGAEATVESDRVEH